MEFLKIFTLEVLQRLSFQSLKMQFACGQEAKMHRKSYVFQNTLACVDKALIMYMYIRRWVEKQLLNKKISVRMVIKIFLKHLTAAVHKLHHLLWLLKSTICGYSHGCLALWWLVLHFKNIISFGHCDFSLLHSTFKGLSVRLELELGHSKGWA